MNKKQKIATFVGLFVALGLPFVLDLLLGIRPEDMAIPSRVILFVTEEWTLAFVLLGIVLLWERQSLASIGIKKVSWRDLLWGVLGFIVGAFSFILTMPLVNALGLGTTSSGISQLAQIPIVLRIGIVLTAGITEEILFRGYPIERINALTGRLGLSAFIAYVVFVLLHIPFWGLGGTIQIGVWSIVITILYVKRRNLLACMLMHILNDAYAFILLPLFAQYLP
ncbi:CPBP family intramembrane glutamic endopeptidase [Meiothermus sp.]|uniref:CPBP family intramembrane glutamic endopeptidase n=1 Tax=Meiothermus sp. TaxID=1955249 RepID=UPI0021DDBE61|nr:type II CAAX endopeptidase family protein [Meiothermus sp.]GIW33948.1 MAG: abortive infection protein [Meiothermus sp.]